MTELPTTKRRIPSVVRWILWVLLVQFVLMNISAAIYSYRLTHFYDSASVEANPGNNIFAKTWKLFTGPRQAKSTIRNKPSYSYDTIQLLTSSGIKVDAWYASPDSAAKGTIILFHGVTINKAALLEEANEFKYWGYNIMLVDFRGHGNSGGNTSTLGVDESEEVKLAFDYLSGKGEKNIFLFGSSMGAVVVSKAIWQYGLQPAGIILDMPFGSLQSYLEAKARVLGFPQQPFAFLTSFWIGMERGFNGFRHQTARYMKGVKCPVLLQWGDQDEIVKEAEIREVFEAIPGNKKKLVVYPGGRHGSLLQHDPATWRKEVSMLLGITS